ncbi:MULTISPECIES: RNase adapter RapZ [Actinomycetes]|uniref:RNase adapter RapZ n=2 Tax=Actinomycetes TaxID=1760 RepID=A0ABP6LS33_9MICC|nr:MULTISPECIES: RNase adapter RapZ [unclassified Nesterenkonia]MDS2171663.1 RNase adapter RapZ [Nesterenkonia sp. CL21]OSM44737.1 RNase adaptor protein RapZ [Nesterenkonia sp. PF2B19]
MSDGLIPVKPPENELLIVTGMSGAGRTTAAHALEDLGWYVVEGLPAELIGTMMDLIARNPGSVEKLAVVIDVRSRGPFSDMMDALGQVRAAGLTYRMLFLDASDELLVRRFEQARRPHPLQGSGRILDGIVAERDMLKEVKAGAEVVVDTTELNVHGLAREITEIFTDDGPIQLRLNVMSFGFKYGVPADANFIADVRFVPNPHWVPELRPLTGLDEPVREYVLVDEGAGEFVDRYVEALKPVLEGYRRENKHYATLAVGCTGGKHRSVAISEELARRLAQVPNVTVNTVHRDLGRE